MPRDDRLNPLATPAAERRFVKERSAIIARFAENKLNNLPSPSGCHSLPAGPGGVSLSLLFVCATEEFGKIL